MLQTVRNNLRGVIAYIIVAIIVVPFALFGVEALVTGRSYQKDVVAEVNGKKLDELEVRRALEGRKRQLRTMLGDRIDPRYLSDEFLRGSVEESLVQQKLLVATAEDSQLRFSDDAIDQMIRNDKNFQQQGKYDPQYFVQLLRQAAYTPATYREALRSEQLANQYQAAFTDTAFTTERQLADLARLQLQKRSFDYLVLPLAKTLASATASKDEVAAYYESHKDKFLSDEQVSVEYLQLRKQDLAASLVVTDEDIRKQYEAEVAKAADKAERHAAHILVAENDQAKLKDIQSRLAKGEDFGALARQFSIDSGSAQNGGDVGVTTGSNFVPEFEDALKKLKVGEVSAPVKTKFGYHIIKLLSRKDVKPPTLDESRKRIHDEIASQLADEMYKEKLETLRDAVRGSPDLAAAASRIVDEHYKVAVQKTALFSRNTAPAALMNRDIINAVFAQGVHAGMTTDLVETTKGDAFVAHIIEFKPSEVRPLADVSTQIGETVRHDKAVAALAEHASKLEAQLGSGANLQALAHGEGVPVQAKTDKQRDDNDVDRVVLQKVFAMAPPEGNKPTVDSAELPDGSRAIVVLKDVRVPVADSMPAEQKSRLAGRLDNAANSVASTILQSVLNTGATIKRYKTTDNAKAGSSTPQG